MGLEWFLSRSWVALSGWLPFLPWLSKAIEPLCHAVIKFWAGPSTFFPSLFLSPLFLYPLPTYLQRLLHVLNRRLHSLQLPPLYPLTTTYNHNGWR